MKPLVLFAVVLVASCSHTPEAAPAVDSSGRKASVLFVGMSFEAAEHQLKLHGAKAVVERTLLIDTGGAELNGRKVDCYILPDHRRLDLCSRPEIAGRVLYSIDVATYDPKSWNGGDDPELTKFYASMRHYKEYELEGGPNQPPLRMPVSGTPAADAPVAPPSSAAGR